MNEQTVRVRVLSKIRLKWLVAYSYLREDHTYEFDHFQLKSNIASNYVCVFPAGGIDPIAYSEVPK